jgi:manganese/zinc/iron transport system permease protein
VNPFVHVTELLFPLSFGLDLAPVWNSLTNVCEYLTGTPWIDLEVPFWTILTGMVVNSACAIVGCYLVLRRMSMLGDAISHSVLAAVGIVLVTTGGLAPIPLFIGAVSVGFLTAFLTQSLNEIANVPEDAGMGVVFTSLFAIGVVLISQYEGHFDLDCVLFGNFEYVGLMLSERFGVLVPDALPSQLLILVITITAVVLFWKELKIASFDPLLATAMGFNASLIHYLLMALVAGVTVSSLQAVGAILVIAMLIVPAATAHLLTDRMSRMLIIAVGVGCTSAIVGYYLAARFDSNSAGMMAVVAGLQFATAVFLAPQYGLVSKLRNNARLALRVVSEDVLSMLYRAEESAREAAAHSGATFRQCVEWGGGGVYAWLSVYLLRYRGQLAATFDGRLQLTESGRRTGRSLLRSHRLWEAYISKHFELDNDHLHDPAERIEHYIGPELQEQLERELETPEFDPQGKPIPRAE